MKKFILFVLCCSYLLGEESTHQQPPPNVEKISEAFGHLLGKNLETMGIKFDLAKVTQGLQDSLSGKPSPMTETEYFEAVSAIKEAAFKETAVENLKKAEQFLAENEHVKGVQTLENGKVQYRIDQEGKGAAIDENSTPLIRFTGKFLDSSVFSTSKEEEMIQLDETIPGFRKGILGMKEGEKRTIYIHPDLGYQAHSFPPNALLTFEIEVVKANAPHAEALDSLHLPTSKPNPEIASPFEEPVVVR